MHGMLPSFVGDKVTHVAKPLEFWCNLSNSKILMGIEVSDDCAGQSGAVLEDVTMLGHDVEEPNRVCEIKPKKERWKSLAMDAKLDNGNLRRFLDALFDANDVRVAIFDMNPSKAPGNDGLPASYYQQFWETIGDGVTSACL
ncbi:hypothetical protein ACOSQ3_007197 [Xanthoceras sorbifolium]